MFALSFTFQIIKVLFFIAMFWPVKNYLWAVKKKQLDKRGMVDFFSMMGLCYLLIMFVPIILVKALGIFLLLIVNGTMKGVIDHNLQAASQRQRSNSSDSNQRKNEGREKQSKCSFNPYEVLDVPQSANKDEIQAQFRKLMSQYHPDRVNHLGKELQELAHEKTIQIKKAYDLLLAA